MRSKVYVAFVVAIAALFMVGRCAKAEMSSSFGGGYKFAESSLMDSRCVDALIFHAGNDGFLTDEQGRQRIVPCGGSQPLFIGWPIAWDSDDGRWRVGWFHVSHWLSGPPFNHKGEISFNCVCFQRTFKWRRN